MRTLKLNEQKVLQLYNSGKNDTKIGKTVGKTPNTIAYWRHRRNLPANIGSIANGTYLTGVNYRDVLEPNQVEEMGRFLKALCIGARECKRIGVKPDISEAMRAWGNVPKTVGERAITMGFVARERVDATENINNYV